MIFASVCVCAHVCNSVCVREQVREMLQANEEIIEPILQAIELSTSPLLQVRIKFFHESDLFSR